MFACTERQMLDEPWTPTKHKQTQRRAGAQGSLGTRGGDVANGGCVEITERACGCCRRVYLWLWFGAVPDVVSLDTQTHIPLSTHTHTRTNTHPHWGSHTYTPTYVSPHPICVRAYPHTHAHTHMHTRMHTPTRTHPYTQQAQRAQRGHSATCTSDNLHEQNTKTKHSSEQRF